MCFAGPPFQMTNHLHISLHFKSVVFQQVWQIFVMIVSFIVMDDRERYILLCGLYLYLITVCHNFQMFVFFPTLFLSCYELNIIFNLLVFYSLFLFVSYSLPPSFPRRINNSLASLFHQIYHDLPSVACSKLSILCL